jgi:hypothetical protein
MKIRKRFRFDVSTIAMAVALALFWAGERGTACAAEQHPADQPATHNMLVVGEQTVYLSHLPMFQEEGEPPMPHRYQAILEVTFAKQEGYVKDRRGHQTTNIYTLNPERFVLPELIALDPQRKSLSSFKAKTIFRGHLERDARVPILQEVKVSVKRVIHFREFDAKAQKAPQLEYLLFGKGQELFLAHVITAPPDFDQILAVKVTDHEFPDKELAKGVPVIFPGTTNAAAARLREKQQIAGEMKVANASAPKTVQVEVSREFYFEEGELQVPPDFKTTAAEKQAGFP